MVTKRVTINLHHLKSKIVFALILCASWLSAQTTIAVVDFEGDGLSATEVSALSDRLRDELFRTEKFKVIERNLMDEILEEQGFQLSGCTSDECIVEIGRLISVQLIVGGNISKVGNTFSVSTRSISVETGEIINVSTYDCTGDIDELLIKGMRSVALQLTEEKAPESLTIAGEEIPESETITTEEVSESVPVNGIEDTLTVTSEIEEFTLPFFLRFSSMKMDYPKGLSLISDDFINLNHHILKVNFPSAKSFCDIDFTGKNLIFTNQINGVDLLNPQGISLERYYELKREYSTRRSFIDKFVGPVAEEKEERRAEKIELIGADIAGQRVSLRVSGNVNINGRLQNQKQSQVRTGYRQGQSTTFIIDQKQQLNLEGKIGDRISILVDQDSERDFDFENAMKIIYTGNEDDIVQKIEAGNISLSLPGTQFVTFSGRNNGLFGLKGIMKLGGLDVTTIASIEKGKKEKMSVKGGAMATEEYIRDYDYRRNLYFFLDKTYRNNFYPLKDGRFTYDPDRVVADLEVYKSIKDEIAGSIWGIAYVDPNATSGPDTVHIEQRVFKRLERDLEYYAELNLGYIRLATQAQNDEILAVAYRVVNHNKQNIEEYGDWDRSYADTTDIELKLIKPQHMIPSNPCWDLEFKNVYYLGASGINEDGFELKIVYIHGNKDNEEERDRNDGETFLHKFGLDEKDKNNNPVPDDIIDIENGAVISLQLGELWLPYLRPFQYGEDDQTGERNPNLNNDYNCSAMYDSNRTLQNDIIADMKFKVKYKHENRSANISLGPMIIEGSEEVTLGNQHLTRGMDYTIDYFTGTLTLLNQDALSPDADLDIKFEKNQFFQLDKKTIMGARAQYDFGENSYIGGTALYFNQSVIDEKVDVGYEPMRNFVWDMNARFTRNVDFLSRAIDRLPVIKTDQPSTFSFEGEVAQVLPNPNTLNNENTGDPNGVGFIDDFEGAKRITSPTIMRRFWSKSSAPIDKNELQRGFTFWFNPYGGVNTKDIWPNKETSVRAQNNITEILIMCLDPQWSIDVGDDKDPKKAWGGITYPFPTSYYDQSKTKFLEIWVKGDSGHLHIDLGQISEDAIPDRKLNTEDVPEASFKMGNNLLDLPEEDTGIDGLFDEDEFIVNNYSDTIRYNDPRLDNYKRRLTDPHSDNWKWSEGSSDYRYVNGTEGNSKDVSGLYPDTEDLNRNFVLDHINDYYTIDFYLDDPDQPYIAGRTFKDGGSTGWKLYRIPLSDFEKDKTGSNVTWQTIRACRLWFDEVTSENSIWIAKIEMVGNEWEEMGVAADEKSDFVKKEEAFAITVVNTEDNEYYDPPKGVQGEYDRINEIRAKEQSLVLQLNEPEGLKPGELCAAKKVLMEENSFINYKKMKLFINGHNLYTNNGDYNADDLQLQFFIRFGRGGQNPQYYEYRQPVYSGWDKRNKMEIDLDFITKLKSYSSEDEYPYANNEGLQEFWVDDTGAVIKRYYKEVEEDKYTGKEIIVYGTPALSRVQQLVVGLKNRAPPEERPRLRELPKGQDNTIFGEVWLDELRLSGVRKDAGVAYRSNASLKLADLGNVSVSFNRRDADFHTVEQKPGRNPSSLNTSQSFRAQGSFSLHKFTPAGWGLKIPVSGSYSKDARTPKFVPGTDILSGRTPPDSIMAISNSYSVNTSFEKRPSDFWLTRYTIDQMKFGFNAQWKTGSTVQIRENGSQLYSGRFSFRIPFGRDNYIQPFKFVSKVPVIGDKLGDLRWYYTPSKLDFSMNASESHSTKIPRWGESVRSYDMGLNRTFNLDYKVFDNLNLTYTKTMKNDMDKFRGQKLRALKEWKSGVPTSVKENFSASYSPKIFSWFTPSINYGSNYAWSKPLGSAKKSVKELSSQNKLSTSFSLSLSSIVESFYTPKSRKGRSKSSSRRGSGSGREGVTTPSLPELEKEEKKPSNEIKALEFIYKYLKKVQPLSVSYSVNQTKRNWGRVGSPGVLYRLGFQKDPGLDIIEEEVGVNVDNISTNVSASVRSGLDLMKNVKTSFSYSQSMAWTLLQGNQTGTHIIKDFIPLGENGKGGFPFPGWNVKWSGLGKIKFLSKFLRTLSLDHGFSGKEDKTLRNGEEDNSTYKASFQPLLGVSLQFKNGVNSTIRMGMGQTTNNRQSGTEITDAQNASATVSYQRRGGMTVPLPFFENLNLENNINFSMTFDYNSSVNRARNRDKGKFAIRNENTSWKISPKINYSFTKKVTGGIYYQYSESKNRRTGKRINKNYGFDINIAIRG